jgi:hypothetical protein
MVNTLMAWMHHHVDNIAAKIVAALATAFLLVGGGSGWDASSGQRGLGCEDAQPPTVHRADVAAPALADVCPNKVSVAD